MTQKAEITFEVEETIVLKQGGKLQRDLCPRCGITVDMLSPDVLSLVSGATEREIFRLVETDAIYFVETGRLVACPSCFRKIVGLPAAIPNVAADSNESTDEI